MKKIAVWLLAVLLLFTFAACGSAEEPDGPENPSAAEDVENPGADSGDREEEEAESEPEKGKKEFSLGVISGQVWENAYIGLGCEFPDSWEFGSEKELAELNGMTMEYMPEDFAEQMKNADIVYDMLARSQNGIANVNVNFEKLTALQVLTHDTREAMEGTLDVVKEAYENMGYTNVSISLDEVQIDGKTLESMYLRAEAGDYTMYVKTFQVLCSGHVGNITMGAVSEAELQQLADGFYWL